MQDICACCCQYILCLAAQDHQAALKTLQKLLAQSSTPDHGGTCMLLSHLSGCSA